MSTPSPKTKSQSKPRVLNVLSLLAHKVASNTFDLSCGLQHVSIRDQIVRATLLARDLAGSGERIDRVLVVGAGFAGVTFARTLLEISSTTEVLLVDKSDLDFSTQRNVIDRYVGPYMYEWPSDFYDDQSYPSTSLGGESCRVPSLHWQSKKPLPAAVLVQDMELPSPRACRMPEDALKRLTRLKVQVEQEIKDYVQSFAKKEQTGIVPSVPLTAFAESMARKGLSSSFKPDYVVLAAGMGAEKTDEWKAGNKTPMFWGEDKLISEESNGRVAVIGGGDGAIQDALRFLTQEPHPLKLLERLRADEKVFEEIKRIQPALLSMDRQTRIYNGWTSATPSYQEIDQLCHATAVKLVENPRVRDSVRDLIAGGGREVHIFVGGTHFTKAYLLNRFLIHLIAAAEAANVAFISQTAEMDPVNGPNYKHLHDAIGVALRIHFNCKVKTIMKKGKRSLVELEEDAPEGARLEVPFDLVIQRIGVEQDPLLIPQVCLSDGTAHPRATLNSVELPFVVWS